MNKFLLVPSHSPVPPASFAFQASKPPSPFKPSSHLRMSSLFTSSMPKPSPKETADDIYRDLVADFNQLMIQDPIVKALWNGTMKWGDIPGILDVKPRRASIASVASDESEEYDLVRLCSHSRRVAFADKPVVKQYNINEAPVSVPEVPPFTVGIKTVIARNLPRDITVHTLRGAFEKYGPIKDIYIPKNMDRSSQYFGTIKGFALIKFLNPEHSAAAYTNEYGRLVLGRNNITLEFAKEDR